MARKSQRWSIIGSLTTRGFCAFQTRPGIDGKEVCGKEVAGEAEWFIARHRFDS
jgi:hypothetical protein